MFCLRNKKFIFQIHTLICRPEFYSSVYGKYTKNATKMLVIRCLIFKIVVKIANSDDQDQTAHEGV